MATINQNLSPKISGLSTFHTTFRVTAVLARPKAKAGRRSARLSRILGVTSPVSSRAAASLS